LRAITEHPQRPWRANERGLPGNDSEQHARVAFAPLYRGEVYRGTAWRMRLDSTTNWAVVTTGIALSATFSVRKPRPYRWCSFLIVSVFLPVEARRYRYFNVWRARAFTRD
jgi:uncharacterized membrane protein